MNRIEKLMEILRSFKNGGKSPIHIKEKNKGKFTRSAKAAGRSVQEHARHVVNDPNATTLQKRRAQFALNAKKWKHQKGGIVYTPFENQYTTNLSPAEEQAFRDWYRIYSSIHGLNANPDEPEHYYDYRGYWKNGPEPMSLFTNEHLPDKWKVPGHPSFSDESIYAGTNNKPTIENLADFTGGFETFSATPYVLKTSDGKDQVLAGYGSANPEIIKLAREGKLTKEIAKKEMIRRLQADYEEWSRRLPEFNELSENVKLALVDTSYNGKGVQYTIAHSPNLIRAIKSGVRDGKVLAKHMDHSKTAGSWLGVRSSARRAMAQDKYDWNWETIDKFGRQVDYNQYKGPEDWKSSPYYNKYQQGGLIYNPFVVKSLNSNTEQKDKQESLSEYINRDTETPFPVEPVKFEDLSDYTRMGTYQVPHYENKVTRGVTEFKTDNIDVGNMRELLDKFEEAGISVRVTSGRDNRKTKSGKVSKHAVADAIDITPIKGETYEDLRNKIMNSPELLEWMRDNQIGIIDETDPLMKAKTGATGNHWHISRGGERLALLGFSRLFG